MKLKEELTDLIGSMDFIDDHVAEHMLMDIIYKRNKGDTLKLFLGIQDRDKKRMEEEVSKHYQATQSAMHNLSGISRPLLEDKTSRGAREYAKYLFEGDNISGVIDIIKIYFPDGTYGGAANAGVWFFDKFVDMLKANREKYEEGGDSREWAERYGHSEYIDMTLKPKTK